MIIMLCKISRKLLKLLENSKNLMQDAQPVQNIWWTDLAKLRLFVSIFIHMCSFVFRRDEQVRIRMTS